jgi:SAM-dependent methyltransferase
VTRPDRRAPGAPAPDQPADPGSAALAAWAARVGAHHAQTARVRETPEGGDFYAPVTSVFIADPRRAGDEVLDRLLELARPGETWLDIGAGAGRFALPLALRVREVIALDPSPGMLAALAELAAEHGIANVRAIRARWPVDPAAGPPPTGDVALIAHLGYDIEEMGPFLDAMEAAARRLCVAVLADGSPGAAAHPFWPPVHGEERIELPALDDLVALLRARGRDPRVVRLARSSRGFPSRDDLVRWLRNQLFVQPGSAKDAILAREVDRHVRTNDDGTVGLDVPVPAVVGIVSWEPRPTGVGGPA